MTEPDALERSFALLLEEQRAAGDVVTDLAEQLKAAIARRDRLSKAVDALSGLLDEERDEQVDPPDQSSEESGERAAASRAPSQQASRTVAHAFEAAGVIQRAGINSRVNIGLGESIPGIQLNNWPTAHIAEAAARVMAENNQHGRVIREAQEALRRQGLIRPPGRQLGRREIPAVTATSPEDDRDAAAASDQSPNLQPKRVRSTDAVVNILRNASGPLSRDQVVLVMADQGLTANMKTPRNAVGSALLRAVKQGRLVHLDGDRFAVKGEDRQPDLDE